MGSARLIRPIRPIRPMPAASVPAGARLTIPPARGRMVIIEAKAFLRRASRRRARTERLLAKLHPPPGEGYGEG